MMEAGPRAPLEEWTGVLSMSQLTKDIETTEEMEVPIPTGFEDELKVFSQLKRAGYSPKVIYDIGASTGHWSEVVNVVFPDADYHLFEPLAEFIPNYKENLTKKLRNHPNFFLHPVALGTETKVAEVRGDANGWNSTTLPVDRQYFPASYKVPQFKLDDYVERFKLPLPDLIKMDTQGSEAAIIVRAPRCVCNASLIFTETWLYREYGPETPLLTDLIGLLSRADFELADIGHRFYNETHRLYCCDAYFLKRDVLKRLAPSMPQERW